MTSEIVNKILSEDLQRIKRVTGKILDNIMFAYSISPIWGNEVQKYYEANYPREYTILVDEHKYDVHCG